MDNKNFQIEGTKIQLPVDAENMKEYDIIYIIDQRHGFILDCPDPYNQYYHNYWGRRELIQVKTLFGVDKKKYPIYACRLCNRIVRNTHTQNENQLE